LPGARLFRYYFFMVVHILLCDAFEGILPRDIPSYPQMFIDLLDSVAPGISYRTYDVTRGELPEPEKNGGLYLITESRAGAYDPLHWIGSLKTFIRSGTGRRSAWPGSVSGIRSSPRPSAEGSRNPPADGAWE
jgi:hypothetical protein